MLLTSGESKVKLLMENVQQEDRRRTIDPFGRVPRRKSSEEMAATWSTSCGKGTKNDCRFQGIAASFTWWLVFFMIKFPQSIACFSK